MNATKEDNIIAIRESEELEILPNCSSIRKKNRNLSEVKSFVSQESKKDAKSGIDDFSEFMTCSPSIIIKFIFSYKLSESNSSVSWDDVKSRVQEIFKIQVQYARLHEGEGHFCVNKNDLSDEVRAKVIVFEFFIILNVRSLMKTLRLER